MLPSPSTKSKKSSSATSTRSRPQTSTEPIKGDEDNDDKDENNDDEGGTVTRPFQIFKGLSYQIKNRGEQKMIAPTEMLTSRLRSEI